MKLLWYKTLVTSPISRKQADLAQILRYENLSHFRISEDQFVISSQKNDPLRWLIVR